jgi:hypothetical protein
MISLPGYSCWRITSIINGCVSGGVADIAIDGVAEGVILATSTREGVTEKTASGIVVVDKLDSAGIDESEAELGPQAATSRKNKVKKTNFWGKRIIFY